MYASTLPLADFDPELWQAIAQETQRQEDHIELIASENYTSPYVMAMQGNVLTNKYAEGYPGKRYYGGCEYVDMVEQLAIDRARALFQSDYANVQPHSGSQANAAVYQALLQPGDVVLGMDLSAGGHLTHGSSVNFSGKTYRAVSYGLLPDGSDIDYDQVAELAMKHQPKLIVCGFSAFSGIIEWERFREIADRIGAYVLADMAHVAGLVAGGVYPSPLPYAHVVTTTTHKTLRGPRSGLILARECPEHPDLFKKLNSAIFPGLQGGPLMHVIAAKAVALLEAQQADFRTYAQQTIDNAKAMAQAIIARGYDVVSGGTHNHMFLIDFRDREDLTGKQAEDILEQAHITVNKNAVPNDPRSPFVTSGLRIGTPAVTTRGFKLAQVRQVAAALCDVLDKPADTAVIDDVRARMQTLCHEFPVYAVMGEAI